MIAPKDDPLPQAGQTWLMDGLGRITLESLRFERQGCEVWNAWTEDPHGIVKARRIVTTIPTAPLV